MIKNLSVHWQHAHILHMQMINRAVFTSPYKCSSGAVGDRIVINHTGKQRHDKHSPYIIAVIIPSYTAHTHTHTHTHTLSTVKVSGCLYEAS